MKINCTYIFVLLFLLSYQEQLYNVIDNNHNSNWRPFDEFLWYLQASSIFVMKSKHKIILCPQEKNCKKTCFHICNTSKIAFSIYRLLVGDATMEVKKLNTSEVRSDILNKSTLQSFPVFLDHQNRWRRYIIVQCARVFESCSTQRYTRY